MKLDNILKFDNIINVKTTSEAFIPLLLLYLIILGNYAGELLGCRMQEIFSEIALAKHIVGLFTLYYFVTLSSTEVQDPYTMIIKSLVMYGIFMISRNVPIYYTLVSMICMVIIKFLNDYKLYYYNTPEDKNKYDMVEKVQMALTGVIVILIIFGFIKYTRYQMIDHKKNWSWWIYMIGKDRDSGCASLHDNATLKIPSYNINKK